MSEEDPPPGNYDHSIVAVNQLIWGEGFLSPGGAPAVRSIVDGLDLAGLTLLDIGCGTGGVDRVLAEEYGCRVIGFDIVPLLIEVGRGLIGEAGLADRVDLRLVEPGPLPLEDQSIDVVFGKDSWLLIADKPAFFGEVFRVLRPGGILAASEWMGDGAPTSPEMDDYFALRGMRYALETAAAYDDFPARAGFTRISVTNSSNHYREGARRELARMTGPLRQAMIDLLGEDKQTHFVDQWRAMTRVLDLGELRSGRLRAHKPESDA